MTDCIKSKLKKKFMVPASDNAAVLEKAAKPGPALDYSEHTRPMYSTTGKNKPIHNPSANREPPKPPTPQAPKDQRTWVQGVQQPKREDLKKSLKSKIATAAALVATAMPSKTGDAPVPQAPAAAKAAPKPQAPAVEPQVTTAAAPQGALVRAHTASEFPEFLISGKWHSPRKVSEMLDILQNNPEHAQQHQSVIQRMALYRKASAGKGKEGYVYPH